MEPSEIVLLLKKDFIFTSKLLLRITTPTTKVQGNYTKHKKLFNNKIVKENLSNIYAPDFDDKVIHNFIENNDSSFFVLFRAPQHPKYYPYIGEINEKYFVDRLSSFGKYENCVIMDFGHKYNTDSLFADLGHMNYKGASVFSAFLADTLANIPELKINKYHKARTHNTQ